MKKVDNATFNNSWYKPGSKLKIIIWYFINVLFFLNPFIPFMGIKIFLLRFFGAKIGKGLIIKPAVNIKYPWFLEIGNNVWIGENVWIDNLTEVKMGDNVCISQGAMLLCGNHNYKKASFDLMLGKIILEEGVWIGAQTTVCPGVTCHSHAILSVGSITAKDLDAYTIYQGNPAVPVRKREIET